MIDSAAVDWAPLPPREKKRSRRGTGPSTVTTPADASLEKEALPIKNNANDGVDGTVAGTGGPAMAGQEGGGGGGGEGSSASSITVDAVNLAKVEQAVEARAALHRAERGGEDMGNDGLPGEFYEYLDHTADVQLHSWGPTLVAALEHLVPCMFNYMTDLDRVQVDESKSVELEVEGHDMPSLLFAYLDEFLYRFSTDSFICKKATILSFDRQGFKIRVKGDGELFDLEKHPQGTEIKAITYSNMQIHEKEDRTDLYVIVDI